MYKLMNELVDVNPAADRSAGALTPQLQGAQIPTPRPPLPNRLVPAFSLPIGNSILELYPNRCSISSDYLPSDLHWQVGWKGMPNKDNWFFSPFLTLALTEQI